METVRFIHCADLHLDRPFETSKLPASLLNRLKRSAYVSFAKIIDEAIAKEVDFVVISGDLYDLEHRSLKGQLFMRKQAERLKEKDILLYIIHGNHDPLTENENGIRMPENVTVFGSKTSSVLHKNNQVRVYGFSYDKRSIVENRIKEYETEKKEDALFHIALLHGQEEEQPDHDPYAPFRVNQLIDTGFDYWALGHIHKRQIISEKPFVVYPGNIQGGHRNERGAKGAYYVELSKVDGKLTFLDTSVVDWHRVEVSINGVDSMDGFIAKCEKTIDGVGKENKFDLIDLVVTGSGPLHQELQNPVVVEECIDELRGDEDVLFDFSYWVHRLAVQTKPEMDREKAKDQSNILGDVLQVIDGIEVSDDIFSELYNHRTARKYVTPLTDAEKKELLDQAEQWLVSRLLKEEA
ncbi:metallophosphoesterase family protein [Alteribacter aurantiacus]|uniref:metallophosphoesterase family protein n=1 Tax=Alteribacter aurantiacus TaxID=254410 RepID=UPI0003FA3FA1|nr:DNA repair exonuclease [Alteribacter aurantiacus]